MKATVKKISVFAPELEDELISEIKTTNIEWFDDNEYHGKFNIEIISDLEDLIVQAEGELQVYSNSASLYDFEIYVIYNGEVVKAEFKDDKQTRKIDEFKNDIEKEVCYYFR